MTNQLSQKVMISERDSDLARSVLSQLDGSHGYLAVGRRAETPAPLPQELGVVLQQVLEAVATGASITVSAVPEEVTPAAAATMLGVSRPTVMKMISDGHLHARKVGSHHRLRSADVQSALRARRSRERAAFEALRELSDDG